MRHDRAARFRRGAGDRRRPGRSHGRSRRGAAQGPGAQPHAARSRAAPRPGPRAAWRRRSRTTTIPICTPRTPWRPAPALCDPEAVAILTGEGPAAVRALAELGAPFDRTPEGGFVQSLEAAHSRPRVARVGGDGAGLAIMGAVIAAVRAAPSSWTCAKEPAPWPCSRTIAGRCRGVLAEVGGRRVEIHAAATVLATGGIGGLYAVTTNPFEARGDGLALAALAGAEIARSGVRAVSPDGDRHRHRPGPSGHRGLARRGRRAWSTPTGEPFMDRYHPAGDLAPRDVVARAIAAETRRGGAASSWIRPSRRRCVASTRTSRPCSPPAGRRASIPRDPADPGRAGGPLPHGRRRHGRCGARPRSPGCSPSANAPPPACTGPTAWPRTRCLRRPCSAVGPASVRAMTQLSRCAPTPSRERPVLSRWRVGGAAPSA